MNSSQLNTHIYKINTFPPNTSSNWRTHIVFGINDMVSKMYSELTPNGFFEFLRNFHESNHNSGYLDKSVAEAICRQFSSSSSDDWKNNLHILIVNYFNSLNRKLKTEPKTIELIWGMLNPQLDFEVQVQV